MVETIVSSVYGALIVVVVRLVRIVLEIRRWAIKIVWGFVLNRSIAKRVIEDWHAVIKDLLII